MTKNIQMKKVNSPLDLSKKEFSELIEKYNTDLNELNFMEEYYIQYDETYRIPRKNKFLLEMCNSILAIEVDNYKKRFIIRKVTNFIIADAYTVKHIFNDKSGEKDTEYFNLTLKSNFGYKKSGIEIKEVAKSNLNKFQEALSLFDNHFQTNFYPNEFKTFFEEFIQPKLKSKTVIIYENFGKIKPNTFLGANFYIENDKIYKENEQGLIPTGDNSVFIKVPNKYPFKLPTLCQSDKKPSIIAKEFIANIIESWGKNYVSALLVIGHIIMGLFFECFIGRTGIPTLIIAGVSGCGKSTLVQNGIAIFGLKDDFLIAGNSTVLAQNFLAHSINSICICIDDLADDIISSKAFEKIMKNLFKAIPRLRKINYGKDVFMEQQCSQIIYSTNSTLPEIPEIENRANLITIMHNSLDTEKYKYLSEHKQNKAELSLILPELLKIDEDFVVALHEELKEYLKSNGLHGAVERIPHNIAYMWTGVKLLEEIADYSIENFDNEVIKYAKEVLEHYSSLPSPVDRLINSLMTLKNHAAIAENNHYKIRYEDGKIFLQFHKETLLEAYNQFFREECQKIKTRVFNNYLKCDKRLINSKLTGNYNGKRQNTVVLDISDYEDVADFSGYSPEITQNKSNNDTLEELNKVLKQIT